MSVKLNTFQRVRELEGWKAVAYATTLLERMLPNYLLFCEVTEFADPSQYRNTLNSMWEWLSVPKAKINFSSQLDKVEELIPDAADFDSYGVYPAIDTCMSMSAAVLLILGDDPQGAVVVSKLSQGTVEAYIEATADNGLTNEELKAHPLMQWEIAFQQDLLEALESAQRTPDLFKQLRAMAKEEGMSNIGLEM